MRRKRPSPEQMVKKLHPAAPELAGGKKIEEICKVLEISPARKRGAVSHLQRGLEMSQRQAWQVVVQPRATQRYVPEAEAEEERLRARLRAFSRERPCAGYRTACGQLRQEGLRVNPKRVQRLWREEGLKVATAARRVATRRATDGGYGICAWSMSSCVRAWRWKCGGVFRRRRCRRG